VTRILLLALTILVFLAGVFLGTAMYYMPPDRDIMWFLAAGMAILGMVGMLRLAGPRFCLTAIGSTALALWAVTFFIWPPTASPPLGVADNGSVTESSERPIADLETVELEVPDRYRRGVFEQRHELRVPPGARIAVFAAGLEGPRLMTVTPAGDILVSEPGADRIRLLRDDDRDGVAETLITYADDLQRPHGLAFHGQNLYVAETGRLSLLRDENGDGQADTRRTISRDIPGAGGHWTRTVVVADDGTAFVSAGSSCNVCEEEDPRRAAVLEFGPGEKEAEIFARGLRNSVGLALHPDTGELWGSDNGRDMLGDDLPPEEINLIRKGSDYGWPYCYGNRTPDPKYDRPDRCKDTTPPQVTMQAHSAPLGIAFGKGLNFPETFQKMLFVGFHGSWNRSVPTGYKLVGIPFEEGRPVGGPVDIISGWLEGRTAWGRPVGPLVGPDGALYLSDDRTGAVYRIWFPERQ